MSHTSHTSHSPADLLQAVDDLVRQLEAFRYAAQTEAQLQDGIETRLVYLSSPPLFTREFRLSPRDRIDFLIEFRGPRARFAIGIEVKIAGSLAAVTRQLYRYAQYDQIDALILVTSRVQLAAAPRELNGKPVRVVATMGAFV